MKKMIRFGALLGAMCFVFAMVAKADNIHLCDVSTGCSSSNVISISLGTTTAYLSGNATGDELFLAILSPLSDTSGNWSSGTLWSALGVSGGSVYPTLASAISQELIGAGITAESFNATDMNLLTMWTSNPQTVTLPSEATGTIFLAFTENADGTLGLVTPWSSSLAVGGGNTSVPEPSSLMLLAAGMVALIGVGLIKAKG